MSIQGADTARKVEVEAADLPLHCPTPAEPEADTAAGADTAEEVDDSDLDEQTYEEDDDDFVPTEEIPADEPIPFPSNRITSYNVCYTKLLRTVVG